jgi:PAS domain S-box-containing protein
MMYKGERTNMPLTREATLQAEPETLRLEIAALRALDPTPQHAPEVPCEQEAGYRLLFESNPHPMWVYATKTLAFLAVNDAAVHHYSYSRDEFLAMTIKDIRPPDDIPALLRQTDESPFQTAGRWRHVKKDGSLIQVEITSHSIPFAGRDARMVLITDVTERQRAEQELHESEARLHQVMSGARCLFFSADVSTDPQGGLRWQMQLLDEAAAQRFFPLDVAPGQSYEDAWYWSRLPEDQARLNNHGDQELRAGCSYSQEFRCRRKDGEIRWLHEDVQVETVAPGRWRTIGVCTDITERKQAEEALAHYAAKLEFNNRELQEFSSVASHDLQEPLRKIQTFGDRLKAKCGATLSEDGRDYLERMQNAAGRMQILIRNLLDLSRVTSKGQPFIPVDLAAVTREVVSDLEAQIEQTEGRVEVGDLPTLDADPLQMRQLLQNLISNALKFHRTDAAPLVQIHGGLIEIQTEGLGQTLPSGECCQIIVADNGIGFDEKYLDRIFTSFQRLHTRSEYEGTGIGLSICRRIVERHGGSITAKSTPGQGAAFIITFPLRQPKG